MHEGVFPQIQAKMLRGQFAQHLFRRREGRGPHVRARVGVRLPMRFQTQDIARHALLPHFRRQTQDVGLRVIRLRAIPEAQPPARRQRSAPGKKVVALHRLPERRTGEDIHIGPGRHGNFNQHFVG